jgi:hypothetical protein
MLPVHYAYDTGSAVNPGQGGVDSLINGGGGGSGGGGGDGGGGGRGGGNGKDSDKQTRSSAKDEAEEAELEALARRKQPQEYASLAQETVDEAKRLAAPPVYEPPPDWVYRAAFYRDSTNRRVGREKYWSPKEILSMMATEYSR